MAETALANDTEAREAAARAWFDSLGGSPEHWEHLAPYMRGHANAGIDAYLAATPVGLREALLAMVYVYLRDAPIASTVVDRTVGHLAALRGINGVFSDKELEELARETIARATLVPIEEKVQ